MTNTMPPAPSHSRLFSDHPRPGKNPLRQAQAVATDTALVGLEPVTGACIPRATDGIALANIESLPLQNNTLELDFYRNTTYACRLTGNYRFMVLNPAGRAF